MQEERPTIAQFIVAITISSLALILVLNLSFSERYSDFIVGNIAWSNGSKTQDLIAWPVFIITFFGVIHFRSNLLHSLNIQIPHKINHKRNIAIIIFAMIYATLIINKVKLQDVIIISLLLLYAVRIYRTSEEGEAYNEIYNKFRDVIALSGFALLPIATILIGNQISLPFFHSITKKHVEIATYASTIVYLLILIHRNEKTVRISATAFANILLISQIILSTLYLSIADSLHKEFNEKFSILNILPPAIIAISITSTLARRLKYNKLQDHDVLVSPIAIFAIVALYKFNNISVHLQTDDYHFGEMLVGYLSLANGSTPYVDYIPPHGLIVNDLSMAINKIFLTGTAIGLSSAQTLTSLLLSASTFYAISKTTKSTILALLVAIYIGSFSFLYITPFVCLLLSKKLNENKEIWIVTWLFSSILLIIGTPAQGILLSAAFSIFAIKHTSDLIKSGKIENKRLILISIMMIVITSTYTPLLEILSGCFRYLLQNGPINQTSYGTPWHLSWHARPKYILLEISRMLWAFALLLFIHQIYNALVKKRGGRFDLFVALVFSAFLVALIPYTMGRIDPFSPSRPGQISLYACLVLIPLAFWNNGTAKSKVLILALIAFLPIPIGTGIFSLRSIAPGKPNTFQPTKNNILENALHQQIGLGIVEPSHLDRLETINNDLLSLSSPNETYLDLTSRNAQYFYFNRVPAIHVTAPYNLVHHDQQKTAVDNLAAHTPNVALLEADNIIHDGGGLALRNHYLYRFVLQNFEPVRKGKFIYGLKKDQAIDRDTILALATILETDDTALDTQYHTIQLEDKKLTNLLSPDEEVIMPDGSTYKISRIVYNEGLISLKGSKPTKGSFSFMTIRVRTSLEKRNAYYANLFAKAFSVPNLQKIPVSWGHSEYSLASMMSAGSDIASHYPLHNTNSDTVVITLSTIKSSVYIDIPPTTPGTDRPGLLKLDIKCANKEESPQFQISWRSSGIALGDDMIDFTGDDGVLIVPLDARPSWLLGEYIDKLKIELKNPNACTNLKIKKISLHSRILY